MENKARVPAALLLEPIWQRVISYHTGFGIDLADIHAIDYPDALAFDKKFRAFLAPGGTTRADNRLLVDETATRDGNRST